ncbi:MAG: phosphoribosylamine--glycine ligase [Candidatus Cloacimonadaceae bacterium]|nr:phosphoribosylamine--glycine ligase [Candidatus Cloacimonadota bacterium]MDY0127229.1 phosphoribosylamine--glycine ligase [Candidatus Cloacimonadaceae bacterium]MCB5254614.1 phosphoribosylamine--glycine ligase [Candidatus Cloacimonadota bacterium]MCK9178660.1 phosphoribosylamine--glycine ligase [Candidatus Cloacimonadota bacterium]MCK9242161.1 phosphoribosylamine--glycine ligase [Candidatus Cloacimonadota bacterium]
MKVLIIGSGGREHAVADAFSRSSTVSEIIVSPGNAGIAEDFRCLPLNGQDEIAGFCHDKAVDLVFIGPEQPIKDGLSDLLRAEGIRVLAPSRDAARLETSKAFAKQLMLKHHVPTASYSLLRDESAAREVLAKCSYPIVLKADGLAAGKGVIICSNESAALQACAGLFRHSAGSSGILAEEYLQGWEVSLFAFCAKDTFQTSLFAQDHKQLYDQDMGPNTGGMGAVCPVVAAEEYRQEIEDKILAPVLTAMKELGCPYEGVLYLGLMITQQGPKVVEFNCRFGDPEAQALLPLLKTDFMELCLAMTEGRIGKLKLEWMNQAAVAVVLAAPGYPAAYKKGIRIRCPQMDSKVFFSGVTREHSDLISCGGRVLTVMNMADTLDNARAAVYRDIESTDFPEKVYRKDIGKRKNLLF